MFVVTEPELAPKVEECKESVPSIQEVFLFGESADYTTLSDLLEEGRAAGTDSGSRPPRTDPRDTPMTVLYSSGTTGLPKGVVSSHFNFVSQIVQSGADGEQILHYTDVLAQWMPCTHLSGVFFTLIALAEGATVVLLPGFRVELLLASVQRYQVLDLDTGKPLAADKDGEILVRGPQMMLGYLNKPEATENAIEADGWYHTGDVGHYDALGQLYIVDRIKDLIKCMDQQVAPAELEDLLMRHPFVRQAAVVGVPHRQMGEAPMAFVVLTDEARDMPEHEVATQLSEMVAETSAPHKHLHGGVQFMEELPKSESGKYLRRQLRDQYMQSMS